MIMIPAIHKYIISLFCRHQYQEHGIDGGKTVILLQLHHVLRLQRY